MRGLNMDRALLVPSLIEYAGRNHGHTEVVSRDSAGVLTHSDWSEIALRARQLSAALLDMGVGPGDRVGTIGWTDHRHLIAYYGITGIEAVLHTVNPRLHDDQISYILNHADDTVVLVDPDFVEMAERVAPSAPNVRQWVVLGASGSAEDVDLPCAALGKVVALDDLFETYPQPAPWHQIDEWSAATLCYTSGTTGNPKGVVQSHRSIVLQTWATCTGDGHNVNSGESILLNVPMFHVNGWAIPFASAMAGAKLVLPGPDVSPEAIVDFINSEDVTLSAGVPTIWLSVVQHLQRTGEDIPTLKRIAVGGSAAPRSLMDTLEDDYGVFVAHVWGMTEMTQGSTGRFTHRVEQMERDEKRRRQAMAGREIYGVELELVDEEGHPVARDGETPGELLARGPWVAGAYYLRDDPSTHTDDGWLRTGDVATMDDEGYITIVDRAKDVIKSGGEWISSIDLENAAVAAPEVLEAAVIGLPHDRWGERPLLLVVLQEGTELDKQAILDVIGPQVASWWLPNDVAQIEEIPHTGTGKIDKKQLRALFADHTWPT